MERYILKYLQDSTQDEWRKRYYDYLKMQLDCSLWAYGVHMNTSNLERLIVHQENYVIPRKNSLKAVCEILKRAVDRKFFRDKRLQKQASIQAVGENAPRKCEHKVFCAFHIPWLLPDEAIKKMNEVGIEIDFISDSNKPWSASVMRLLNWYKCIQLKSFNELINDQYVNELKEIYNDVLRDFKNTDYDAVMVYTTSVFEEKIFIDIFRDLGKISMELLHGIPQIDALKEIAMVDYYLVYGEQLKKNYIAAGCDDKRVVVVGDCKYNKVFETHKTLRCSLDDVLVLTSATSEGYQFEWKYEDFPINDRSLLITYLYSIENVLKQNGVTHARLRPHPQVNKTWLSRYVDMSFYEMDMLNLSDSFDKATFCVGQNSTTVMEALQHGVSYMVYEPGDGKHSITNAVLYPPYDGSDKELRIANSEEQLDAMIKSRYCPSPEIGMKYMEPFKPEVIREILEIVKGKK